MQPHQYRRQSIHFWLLAPIVAALILCLTLNSCTPSKGCYSTKGMAGYSKR